MSKELFRFKFVGIARCFDLFIQAPIARDYDNKFVSFEYSKLISVFDKALAYIV